jgi:hypothetical protein
MKYFAIIFVMLLGCGPSKEPQPDKLIDMSTMKKIIYDMAIIDAMKSQGFDTLKYYNTDAADYIYKKYKIDSLSYVQSNAYYSANEKEYVAMLDSLMKKIEIETNRFDSIRNLERDKENQPEVEQTIENKKPKKKNKFLIK